MGKGFLQALYFSFESFAKTTTSVSVAMVLVVTWVFQHTSDKQPAVAVATGDLI